MMSLSSASSPTKKERRFWIHPLLQARERDGEFHCLVQELKLYNGRFRTYIRMSMGQFETLLGLLAPHLRKQTTNYQDPVDPEQRLAVCLRFLSTGDSFTTIASSFRLGVSTVAGIVKDTCDVIWAQLKETHMPVPNEELWKSTAKKFQESYRFLAVDVGEFGRNSDGGIFANSRLGQALQGGNLNVPAPCPLPSAPKLGQVPFVIVADEAFPMKTFLLRPYPGRRLPEDRRVFNYRLSRARRIVENAFGILSQCWRVYQRRLQVSPDTADSIIKATCILTNYLRGADGTQSADVDDGSDAVDGSGLGAIRSLRGNRASAEALRVRDTFRQYFTSPAGQVPWQYDHVHRGLP
ncbi:uncharacterized protein [Pagrus major]|uniref:uncharacterized protein isoform X2 n=1 Tax=Pagrus major TaxID=143350 RepID=UPI003CC8CA19